MASPSYTYTLTNGQTADASQVMQNFNDILNGVSDGTKDLSINALTVAGTATLNGNINLGNASGDDITVTGSLASTIPIKTTNTYDIGSSTLGLRALYFGANSQTAKIQGSSSMSATWTLTLPVSAGSSGQRLITDGSGVSSWSFGEGNYRGSEGSGTTTLTVTDNRNQIFNISAARTCVLPTTSVLAGDIWVIANVAANGADLTIQASGGQALTIANSCNLDATIQFGRVILVALQNTPTTAAHWNVVELWESGGFANNLTATNFPTTSIQLYYQRTGRRHFLRAAGSAYGAAATGTVNAALSQALTNMPSRLYPSNQSYGVVPAVYQSNAQQTRPGLIVFPTSGAASIYADAAGTNFSGTIGQLLGPSSWEISFDRLN